MRFASFMGAALGALIAGSSASADGGVFTLTSENDTYLGPTLHQNMGVLIARDLHYTNGVRLEWLTPTLEDPAWRDTAAALLPWADSSAEFRMDFSLGQNMFTPANWIDPVPNPIDRPFAGWLYFNAGVLAITDTDLDQLSFGLGVVGPASLAHETQQIFHKQHLDGWDYQLKDEVTLQLDYRHSWRAWQGDWGWLGADLIPHAGFALGTVHVYGDAGLTLRLGHNLPNDFGIHLMDPGILGTPPFGTNEGFAWYVFAGIDGRAIAHDMFLDGGTFRDGPSVGHKTFVFDERLGLVVLIDDVRIAATYVVRSKQFDAQTDADRFGSISLSVRF